MYALNPDLNVLTALGSIAVHAEELLSEKGHDFDRQAILSLLNLPEVKNWLKAMDEMALLPKKR